MKDKKKEGATMEEELRKIQDVPFGRLSIQLGVGLDTAKLIHNLIRDFLDEHGEGDNNPDNNPDRPIFFHKPGCPCRWCKPT